jgi:dGTPase
VATSVARAVGVNVALTEAIALGHDCGHGPGGHASEDALSPYVDGGYDHATWGADVTLVTAFAITRGRDLRRKHPKAKSFRGQIESHMSVTTLKTRLLLV